MATAAATYGAALVRRGIHTSCTCGSYSLILPFSYSPNRAQKVQKKKNFTAGKALSIEVVFYTTPSP